MATTKKQFNVQVPIDTQRKLKVLADREDRPVSSVVRRVLAEAVKGIKANQTTKPYSCQP
jgi:predicted transcriptional regulator